MTDHQSHIHIMPRRTYFMVFAALLVLMFATIAAAYVDLGGSLNIILALGIASMKALLIIYYFMHVGYGSKIVRLFIAGSIFWVFLLFLFTLSDVLSRDWLIKLQTQ